jgi:hypothetical protein|tara:strand:- start:7294 stop:7686 length:393 start_codon:yes stop_codon:yes gene_type:complete
MEDNQEHDDHVYLEGDKVTWELPSGNTLKVKATNPYGFYKIFYANGGELPAELDGAYTSIPTLITAVESYLAKVEERDRLQKELAELKKKNQPPPFKYKKPPPTKRPTKVKKPVEKESEIGKDSGGEDIQ